NKMNGYDGDSIETRLWYDIKHNGSNIRNIHPVKGGDFPTGPDIFLLSNRNFDIQNDTIFLIHISGLMSDLNTQLTVKPIIADKSYGMPPDARQDHNLFFATNDSRVLGAFIQNEQIQFVSNTIDTNTGFAAVYHGVLTWDNGEPQIHGNIISDTALDFGYPNISYTGNSSTDNQSIITFDHSSPLTNGGFSGIFYKGINKYSKRITIKEGEYWVHIISGLVERWGDYTGSQKKYNEPGKVWVSGNFSKLIYVGTMQIKKGLNGTWISEIQSPFMDNPEPPLDTPSEIITFTYPNPATNYLIFEFSLPEDMVLEISIFDNNGKKVKTLLNGLAEKGPNYFSFSTEPLNKGIYFLSLIDGNNIIRTEKFVVGE
ncbi:T9SS type A sorting domain-containing protein, partial [candidate division KSB1 bacterium]